MLKWSKYNTDKETIKLYEQIFQNIHIIDSHVHLGEDKDKHKVIISSLIKSMDEGNINQSIIFPFNHPQFSDRFTEPNDLVFDAFKKYPERIVPFFRLNPHNRSWKDEFEIRHSQGFKGIKLHPRSQEFKITYDKAKEIYQKAQDENMIVLIHAGFGVHNTADDLLEVSKEFSKLKMIIGHSGFVDLQNVIKKLGNRNNIMFDTSTVRIFDLFDLIRDVPYKKIAFGSDAPYYDIGLALETLVDTAIILKKTPNQIKSYLGNNISGWLK